MYEDNNPDFGYNKCCLVDKGEDAFDLLYLVNEGKPKNNIIKRFSFPAYYL
jgi:hypothetical protein